MKGVLISIQPKWCQLIADKKKVVEVRKTRPKLETPFKVYIYETQGGTETPWIDEDGHLIFEGRGQVIGEFVCDRIDRIGKRGVNDNFDYCYLSLNEWGNDDIEIEITDIEKSCISKSELNSYGANAACLYAWRITDLKIYNKPKELSEFYPIKPKRIEDWTNKDDCAYCKYHKWVGSMQEYVEKGKPMREKCTLGKPEPICEYTPPISRPPQSWCYVEVER